MRPFVCIIEGQLALFVVQEHPNFPGGHRVWQLSDGHCESFQVCAPVQAKAQVSRTGVEGAEALPRCRGFCHTESPIALTYLHLPVVAPTGVAHLAHSTPPAIKALPVLWDFLPLRATSHALSVTGDDQVCVGWIRVQSHVLCEEEISNCQIWSWIKKNK